MKKKPLDIFLMTITFPFKVIYEAVSKIGGSDGMYIIGFLAWLAMGVCIFMENFWPISSFFGTIIAIIAIGAFVMIGVFITMFVCELIISMLEIISRYPTRLYEDVRYKYRKDNKKKDGSGWNGSLGSRQKAEVSLSYFIRKEKNKKPYSVVFLDNFIK